MTIASDKKPLVDNSARGLGVRFGDALEDDIPVDGEGNVHPETGGMSVAPSWRELQVHRIPKRLKYIMPEARGSNLDACWRMGTGTFESSTVTNSLSLRKETETHGFVEPKHNMTANEYSQALIATRNEWTIDER